MYGSSFWNVTLNPLASRRAPMEAAASPLPKDDSTPPVIKINFVFIIETPITAVLRHVRQQTSLPNPCPASSKI